MRVGVFLGDQPPEVGGGYTLQWDVFRAFAELAKESGHEFVVFCGPRQAESVSAAIEARGIRVVVYEENPIDRAIAALHREWPLFRARWKRPGKLDRLAREAGVEFMWFVSSGGVFVDMPYAAVVWDLTHRYQPWFPEVSAEGMWDSREVFYSWFLRRASVVIAGTRIGQEQIERFYQLPSERIKILPHPTPGYCLLKGDAACDRSIPEKYKLPSAYLFYPAQFWTHKNHANLLSALKILRDEHRLALPLVLVGSDRGNLEYVKQQVKRLDLASQVFFLGFVPQVDIVGLYKNALALAYVSFCGPENLPPLEAFAAGCPVLASDIPGAKEQLGDAALLARPDRPGEIAAAIKSLHDDKALRDSLIKKGLERAKRFTARDYVRAVFKILDEFEPTRRCWGDWPT